MKSKRILITLTIILMCIGLIFLHMLNLYRNPSLPNWWVRHLESSQTSIEMEIITVNLTNENLHLRLINNTDYLYIYGERYYLFFKHRGRWRFLQRYANGIPTLGFFFDIGFFLHPNSYSDVVKNLTVYENLPDGEYIIIKPAHDGAGRDINVVGRFNHCIISYNFPFSER